MRASAFVWLVFVAGTVAARAQTPPVSPASSQPQFDVASVRPNRLAERPSNNWRATPGRVDYHNSQLAQLIKAAWGDFSLAVEGGPGWIFGDRFDVVVQFPAGTPQPTVGLMLRSLLADRFKLAARLDARDAAVYSLVLARSDRAPGPKLQPGLPDCAPNGQPLAPHCGRGASGTFV